MSLFGKLGKNILKLPGKVVGEVTGANAAARGARRAADVQSAAADRNTTLFRDLSEQTRADQLPYMDLGREAINPLMRLAGLNGSDPGEALKLDPGYQFRLDQGRQALERGAAARGGLLSGGHLKDLSEYSQGLASQEYGNAFSRLLGLVNGGQNAAATAGGQGLQFGNQIADSTLDGANARASGYVARGQRAGNAFNGLLSLGGAALSAYNAFGGKNPVSVPNGTTKVPSVSGDLGALTDVSGNWKANNWKPW